MQNVNIENFIRENTVKIEKDGVDVNLEIGENNKFFIDKTKNGEKLCDIYSKTDNLILVVAGWEYDNIGGGGSNGATKQYLKYLLNKKLIDKVNYSEILKGVKSKHCKFTSQSTQNSKIKCCLLEVKFNQKIQYIMYQVGPNFKEYNGDEKKFIEDLKSSHECRSKCIDWLAKQGLGKKYIAIDGGVSNSLFANGLSENKINEVNEINLKSSLDTARNLKNSIVIGYGENAYSDNLFQNIIDVNDKNRIINSNKQSLNNKKKFTEKNRKKTENKMPIDKNNKKPEYKKEYEPKEKIPVYKKNKKSENKKIKITTAARENKIKYYASQKYQKMVKEYKNRDFIVKSFNEKIKNYAAINKNNNLIFGLEMALKDFGEQQVYREPIND